MVKTVMVVDDQPGIRLLFKEMIKQDGHQVVTAENGREALDKIISGQPDLLIVDYNLPVMNGKGLLEALEQQNIHLPVILMTGLPEKLTEDSKEFNMVKKILAKPFDIDKVREDINQLLARNGSAQQKN